MWPVKKPRIKAAKSFGLCISRVTDVGFKARLQASANSIDTSESDYEKYAGLKSLQLMKSSTSVGSVSVSEMVKIYDQRMAGKRGPARAIYDQIKFLPKSGLCPYCHQRDVSTLDHVLPKAHYPDLAVTPINLVGACMECNKTKSASIPTAAHEVPLHPYFEDVSNDRWLTASVSHSKNSPIIFDITRPASWDALTEARAKRQFAQLQLAVLYSNQAAREICNIRHNLQTHFIAGGAVAVETELDRQWKSRLASSVNSWQTAMYEALRNDAWFQSGGFALV